MTREEFERKLNELVCAAQDWQAYADDSDEEYEIYSEGEQESFSKIMDEFDRLTAEIEQLKMQRFEKSAPLDESEKDLSDYIYRRFEDKGEICFISCEELYITTPESICNQPVDGLLWDLNRDELTCLAWAHKNLTWVNNFAAAKVIRYLHGEVERLKVQYKKTMSALIEIRNTLDRDGRFTHAVPSIDREIESIKSYDNKPLDMDGQEMEERDG